MITIVFSVIGFAIAFYLWVMKVSGKTVKCLLTDKNCNSVIHSKYSRFLGVDNELWGMAYYLVMIVLSGLHNADLGIPYLLKLSVFIAALGMTYSIHLFFIQMRLKQWCDWCTASTIISVIIFLSIN